MKNFVLISLIITLLSGFAGPQKRKIIFFGDSITEAGVREGGYVDILKRSDPDSEYLGAGIGGNKIYDLFFRLDADVIAKRPDVVVIFIGVNDVWHKQSHQTGTDPDRFVRFYEAIIDKLQASSIEVIVCTPAVIGEKIDFSNPQDGDLNSYSTLIREIADRKACKLVDIRQGFLNYNREHNPGNKESGILTTDRVHLNATGNRLVAELMRSALHGRR